MTLFSQLPANSAAFRSTYRPTPSASKRARAPARASSSGFRMALPCATCGEPAYETDVGDGQYYCQACFMAFEDELQAPSVSREEPQLLGRRCWPLHTQAVEAAEEQRRRQRLAGADSDSDDAEPGTSSLAAARAARAKARASVSSGSSAAAGASSDSMQQQQQQLECLVCCDTVASESAMALCGKAEHRFCSDCCWRGCESALGDGLVPACPFDGKERKCGAVGKPTAVAALTHWLGAAGVSSAERSRRKAALGSWGVRGSAKAGFTSTKLDEVYLSAERARSGAVQCIGRPCKSGLRACPAFYVPPVPHSLEPQRRPACKCSPRRRALPTGASFPRATARPVHTRPVRRELLRRMPAPLPPALLVRRGAAPARQVGCLPKRVPARVPQSGERGRR